MKLRQGDTVKVMTGKFKGVITKITKVNTKNSTAFLETDVVMKKHKKPVGDIPGEIIEVPKAIHLSNLAFYDEQTKSTSRIAYKLDKDGNKSRYLVKSDKIIE